MDALSLRFLDDYGTTCLNYLEGKAFWTCQLACEEFSASGDTRELLGIIFPSCPVVKFVLASFASAFALGRWIWEVLEILLPMTTKVWEPIFSTLVPGSLGGLATPAVWVRIGCGVWLLLLEVTARKDLLPGRRNILGSGAMGFLAFCASLTTLDLIISYTVMISP